MKPPSLLVYIAIFLVACDERASSPIDSNTTSPMVNESVDLSKDEVVESTIIDTGKAKTENLKTELEIDSVTGLKLAPGWELVRTHCTACHSARHFLRQKGSRQTWEEIIRWMQKTQGLWVFDSKTETTILDYLATNYAPSGEYRRAPIPFHLLPKTQGRVLV